ncbi:MAG TPA: polyprenyl synthetase family protein [Smithellaceae bacterium]|jgi:octaprenyl-diphosphate synthase|nr:polyprenyl synthetase family protein [Smithellaceae bacterium]HNT91344.1 polyprenyl synthetase family protein [Smithellaceae bacterium]HNV63663.1 polyprenyl synthetase family protein [Smithellaceae bacterium]HNZ31463.1 polyprenyl synthetase family protein [Smithellaceae bacterium]HOF78160.1 polyprenyl synthetase family protein [Smithellaceae bacterium]
MQIQKVFSAYKKDLQKVEKNLTKYITSDVKLIPDVSRHLIDSGGKRFRPLLHLICAGLCGYKGRNRFPMATVMEFIHTATLLHDDVVDQAVIRRGKISANNIWGNAASVLVGDFLYSKSFTLMTEIGNLAIMKMMSDVTNIMSEGEVFQLMKCGDVNLTEEEYLTIIHKKTAVLIAAACSSGAILAGASQDKVAILAHFGHNIGMAFQMTDDTLDYMAKEKDFGKAIGKDLEEGKMTLPLIYALRKAKPAERKIIKEKMARRKLSQKSLKEILIFIQKHGGIDYAMQCAGKYVNDAKGMLNIFPESTEKNQLFAVADYILSREI